MAGTHLFPGILCRPPLWVSVHPVPASRKPGQVGRCCNARTNSRLTYQPEPGRVPEQQSASERLPNTIISQCSRKTNSLLPILSSPSFFQPLELKNFPNFVPFKVWSQNKKFSLINASWYVCACECGNETIVFSSKLLNYYLSRNIGWFKFDQK